MNELYHYGVLGMKWGVRRYRNYDGTLTDAEKARRELDSSSHTKKEIRNDRVYDKRLDRQLNKKTELTTFSYDKDRVSKNGMFYASYEPEDKNLYMALFNKKVPMGIFDDDGNEIGTGEFMMFRINSALKDRINVAGEDSSVSLFSSLYRKDSDFHDFVSNPKRMRAYFLEDKGRFDGVFKDANEILDKAGSSNRDLSFEEFRKIYAMFNYTIPYDGKGNEAKARDEVTNRTKFFNECKKDGYGAVLDVYDSIYGGYKAKAPIVVFDMEKVVPKDIYRTSLADQRMAQLALKGKKALGGPAYD